VCCSVSSWSKKQNIVFQSSHNFPPHTHRCQILAASILSQYCHTFVSCVSTQQLVDNCTNVHFIVNSAVNMGECTISCLRQFFMKRLQRNAFELIVEIKQISKCNCCLRISFGYTRERHILLISAKYFTFILQFGILS